MQFSVIKAEDIKWAKKEVSNGRKIFSGVSQPDSLEDLQKMFVEMVGGDGMRFDFGAGPTATKRPRGGSTKGHAAAKRAACTTSRC